MTECPSGCGRKVPTGYLLCAACWRQVPQDLQRQVYRTWKVYRAVPAGMTTEVIDRRRAARIAYQEARDAALGSIA